MSLYICLNPSNVLHQDWTIMYTKDSGWLWCVTIGSSTIANVATVEGVDNKGDYACVGEGGFMGNLCNFLSSLLWA